MVKRTSYVKKPNCVITEVHRSCTEGHTPHRLSLCPVIREGGRVLEKLVASAGEERAEKPLASLLPAGLQLIFDAPA